MIKRWVNAKNCEYEECFEKIKKETLKLIMKERSISHDLRCAARNLVKENKGEDAYELLKPYAELVGKMEWLNSLGLSRFDKYEFNPYIKCLDSKHLNIKGKIIITDPAFIFITKINNEMVFLQKAWERAYCGTKLELFGFKNFICEEITSGESFYELYINKKRTPSGYFTSKTGIIGVFQLDEIIKFNPYFMDYYNYHMEDFAVINNFDGDVRVSREVYWENENSEIEKRIMYHKQLLGVGENSISKKHIVFKTKKIDL